MKISLGIRLLLLVFLLFVGKIVSAEAQAGKRLVRPMPQASGSRLQASQQGDAILLSWQAVKNCDGYRIYFEKGGQLQPGSFWFDVDKRETSYLFREVSGEQYSFSIAPLYGRAAGEQSAPVTVQLKVKDATGPSDTAR